MIVFRRGIRYIRRVKPVRSRPDDVLSQIKRLHDIESDTNSSYVDKSVSAIKEYMKILDGNTSDPQFWRSIRLFESASPTAQQVAPLLPQLWAVAERPAKSGKQERIRAVGDLAYSVGLLENDEWTLKYLEALSHKNPYRAIELWSKNQKAFGTEMGVKFYCRAGLPKKAEALAGSSEPSPAMCREFILAYCKQHKAAKVDEWIRRFKSMNEQDQRWIWHALRLYSMDNAAAKSLPKPTWHVPAPAKAKLGQRELNLVQELSKLVSVSPQILEDDELYTVWAQFILDPRDCERIEPILDSLVHQDPFVDLIGVLKSLPKSRITDFVLKMDRDEAYPTPGLWEWAQAVQYAKSADQAAVICEKMRLYSYLFTLQGFSAVCNSKVANLTRLADEARHLIPLSEHMLICIWRSLGTQHAPEWLWKLSGQHDPSFRLLKNIVAYCLDNRNVVGVARALYDFMVTNNAALEEPFVDWMVKYAQGQAKETKFSSPQSNPCGLQAWIDVCHLVCQKTSTLSDWVFARVPQKS